jgi:hypothetical protein
MVAQEAFMTRKKLIKTVLAAVMAIVCIGYAWHVYAKSDPDAPQRPQYRPRAARPTTAPTTRPLTTRTARMVIGEPVGPF